MTEEYIIICNNYYVVSKVELHFVTTYPTYPNINILFKLPKGIQQLYP